MNIKKAAVIGAGTMGAAIAAHFANCGIETLLLDIVPKELSEIEQKQSKSLSDPDVRNRFALAGLKRAKKSRPASFYRADFASLVSTGNLTDDIEKIGEADWIVEAVIENIEIKHNLLSKIDKYRKAGSIVSSNTSGLSINGMIKDASDDLKAHFLGTHFFNPPRYLKLVELIPSSYTEKKVVEDIKRFIEDRLGKATVLCKDTPNFIANRIGIYAAMKTYQLVKKYGLSPDEADKLTGKLLGRPKTATFRLADMVGVDVIYHVAKNVYENASNDPYNAVFNPEPIESMIKNGLLGDKTRKGFYKKAIVNGKKRRLVLDLETGEYKEPSDRKFKAIENAKSIGSLAGTLKAVFSLKDEASEFVWKAFSYPILYAITVGPEIADNLYEIDNAIKWGFNWKYGPFELADKIGTKFFVERLRKEGTEIPEWIEKMLQTGASFYNKGEFYDWASGSYKQIERNEKIITLKTLKNEKTIIENQEASLIDLDDGVACLEFHTKMNAIGPGIVELTKKALDEVDKNYKAVVIANNGSAFSAGANLALMLMYIQNDEFDEIDWAVREFQNMTMSLKRFRKPVVAAPHGITVGGGCEVCLHSTGVIAAAETYMGLVEVGVGVIPAGGGTKELLMRTMEKVPKGLPKGIDVDLNPFIAKAFESIAMAHVSTSAFEAKSLGYMRKSDRVVINGDYLISEAKKYALYLAESDSFEPQETTVKVAGRDGKAFLMMLLYNMQKGGYISEHDKLVGEKLANVITGGDVPFGTIVSEQQLLDLEREAFLSLCGQRKTQERMAYMLEHGKPLRN